MVFSNSLPAQVEEDVFVPRIYHPDMRILMIFSPDSASDLYSRQLNELSIHISGVKDRDLVAYSFFPTTGINPDNERINQANVEKLRRQFDVQEKEFKVILIGKDGTLKHTEEGFLSTDVLFPIIDAMPMRRQEMRNR